jgi:hypothetical protein
MGERPISVQRTNDIATGVAPGPYENVDRADDVPVYGDRVYNQSGGAP